MQRSLENSLSAACRVCRSGMRQSAPVPSTGCIHRLHGMPVAVRVVRSAAEQSKAHREVAAYERLSSSQGWLVPRLVAHGSLPDGKGHFVVTEYVEGVPWNWDLPAHQALSSQLRVTLHSIHKLGVKHGDLHEGNILVATDGRVMLLDFDNATVEAPAGALEDEDCLLLENLVMKVDSRSKGTLQRFRKRRQEEAELDAMRSALGPIENVAGSGQRRL